MDAGVLGAAGEALVILMDPFRLIMLSFGVLMGLFLGIIPGIGGLAGMALLLPFTYSLDPYTAFAMLLGMSAVTGTSDTIPAVLFGVPGSASAQATVMDGNPMAKRGEAGRALSAAYTASLIGGLFGAMLLAFTIPMLRPIMLYIASPELLALSLLGISMVAILSGKAPMRGLIAAALGAMLSMIGMDPQTGALRWTLGTLYLWEGLPLVPMTLGLFALPELADLAIKREAISAKVSQNVNSGRMTGVKDAFKNWWLVLRCGGIGAGIGAVPGLGASVVDWITYGHALQTVKGAQQTFGKGDVRGVIAPEAANNAITAGSLVPTIAFGVPGSASMAILLSVFLIHGLVPGPAMLTENLDVTFSMVWSIAIANILGAGICFMFSGQLAKIATLRYTLILPAVLVFVFIGAFQSSRSWGDIYTLLIFGVVGWTMKQLKWPRPPLILGFVLGSLIESYLFISFNSYGASWLTRPIVMVVLGFSLMLLCQPMYRHYKAMGGVRGIVGNLGMPQFHPSDLMHVFMLAVFGYMVVVAIGLPRLAKFGPLVVGIFGLVVCAVSLLNQVYSRSIVAKRTVTSGDVSASSIHMDTAADFSGLSKAEIAQRAGRFSLYLLLFMLLMATVGLLTTVPIFVAAFMWFEGRENWKHIVGQAVVLSVVMYVVFDRLLNIPWPQTLLGQWIPALTVIPSV